MKILMVCLGNICRSPLAHGVMEHLVKQKGLNWKIDSAGTGSWHIGHQPDRRSIAVAKANGIDITNQRARQFSSADFNDFDLILVMDKQNYRDVIAQAKTPVQEEKVKLFIPDGFVPDPYYNDEEFLPVFDMVYTQCEKLLQELSK
ncbi:low molecular weight protein-tyrosine-phosphatase [Pedobacter puniceum]|jgi:protein-tyrosine phosphatase|uniref:protein-tyrosine-phosphatase n=1 Tax=Pedobacter puniceum TaxID=2666136 RepID=A0A7K0FPJ1_9SPHI|nr:MULTISPECIES: low molecular weight protein-tyrosine-phosphatase [Pedobacter]KHJ38346.1 Low molecular weight protein-tyrosine-phosphatase YfkJ [Pedobacter glucosidilyticus]MRX47793.1 low molecular weight phosphotyrosine protein phosphatase [Pedobacter puniceum]